MGLRYLIGCSSLKLKDPAEGRQMYRQLVPYRVSGEFETTPTEGYARSTEHEGRKTQQPAGKTSQSLNVDAPAQVKVPRLLRSCLALGARIAAPHAWDRSFDTIDFLTLLGMKSLTPVAHNRFPAPLRT